MKRIIEWIENDTYPPLKKDQQIHKMHTFLSRET